MVHHFLLGAISLNQLQKSFSGTDDAIMKAGGVPPISAEDLATANEIDCGYQGLGG